jgi:dolichol-phosphate mannosyltransferase
MENLAGTSLLDGRVNPDSPQASLGTTIEKCLVILPTCNESDSTSHIIKQIQSHAPSIEILVIDYHTPNGFADRVKQFASFGKTVRLMNRPYTNGPCSGYNYKDAFESAILEGFDAVVVMNADLSHDPADIPKLLNALDEEVDLAVGSRYLHGVRVLNWPQSRLWINSLGGWCIRFLSGLSLSDPTSGFKAIRSRMLEKLDWQKFTTQGYAFKFEFLFFAWQAGFKVVEVPIVFTERRGGVSKMSAQKTLKAAKRLLQVALLRVFP